MTQAYQSVLRDGLSIRRAAEEFNVPRTTLADRVSGKVQDGSRSGRARYLTDSEESHSYVIFTSLFLLHGGGL